MIGQSWRPAVQTFNYISFSLLKHKVSIRAPLWEGLILSVQSWGKLYGSLLPKISVFKWCHIFHCSEQGDWRPIRVWFMDKRLSANLLFHERALCWLSAGGSSRLSWSVCLLFCCDLNHWSCHNWYKGLHQTSGVVTWAMPPHPTQSYVAHVQLTPHCSQNVHTPLAGNFTSCWPIRWMPCCITATAIDLPISFPKYRWHLCFCLFGCSRCTSLTRKNPLSLASYDIKLETNYN